MIPSAWREGEVAVIGLGRTGRSVAAWLAARGVTTYVSDLKADPDTEAAASRLRAAGASVDVGRHDLDRIRRAAGVVVSPGVPPGAPPLEAARATGVPVVAELDLAARALAPIPLIVVTGTNGKTTTVSLIAHLLAAGGVRTEAAGNIGRPLIDLANGAPFDWIVVEASSFQLHDAPSLAPAIGVLTNLAPDHLNRYESVEAYYDDKRRLFQHAEPSSQWIVNGDDRAVMAMTEGVAGHVRRWSLEGEADAWWDRAADRLVLDGEQLMPRSALPLIGDHNVSNALAAALTATAAGLPRDALAAAYATFRPPPHRLEPLGRVAGLEWINDSKATNVASALMALRALDVPFVWIAGGEEKREDLAPLRDALGTCRLAIFYGETAGRFRDALGGVVEAAVVDDLGAAVALARARAPEGATVLLSPACASFDQFRDYEDRGETFRRLVRDT